MFRKTLPLIVMLSLSTTIASPVNYVNAQEQKITNEYWWPNQLDLTPLRINAQKSNPMGDAYDYAKEFET